MIDTYQNLIFSICYKITGNYFDSEDLAQETFLSAYKNFSNFDGRNEKAWICRIATNKCLDYKRKASNNQIPTEDVYFQELADSRYSTEEMCMEELEREKLLHNCKNLKPPYAEVAIAYFYEELNVSQMADRFIRNEKTLQTQVYRAKAMLQRMYERKEVIKVGRKEKHGDC